ncbi:diphosphomevalonate decarboxylase [Candidatus Dependentiae bacterium]|nr:diphosphomevalonate decarboxylase [Candidatus Dependentiae bacterium]
MKCVKVTANANIALIKYWGKRNEELMLPTKNSLSLTLAALKTTTTISFNNTVDCITFGAENNEQLNNPISSFLNTVRNLFGIKRHFSIASTNHFPTASGLASSASGFAALALGINSLCKLQLNTQEISMLARLGSGSAARSVYGGIVLWYKGEALNGNDSYAEQLFDNNWLPDLRILILVTTTHIKKTSSRVGMQQSLQTSPQYAAWVEQSENRLHNLIQAIQKKDLSSIGSLTEADWEGMRDVILTTIPQLDYWNDASAMIIKTIKKLRQEQDIPCFITTDAGPHVKIICSAKDVVSIQQSLQNIPGIISFLESTLAPAPIIEEL